MNDDPTTYDAPEGWRIPNDGYGYAGDGVTGRAGDPDELTVVNPTPPRRYVLSGGDEPQASVALAVLGTMLTEADDLLRTLERAKAGPTAIAMARAAYDALRRARNRVAVADAESRR
jgi:hypothetical protein